MAWKPQQPSGIAMSSDVRGWRNVTIRVLGALASEIAAKLTFVAHDTFCMLSVTPSPRLTFTVIMIAPTRNDVMIQDLGGRSQRTIDYLPSSMRYAEAFLQPVRLVGRAWT